MVAPCRSPHPSSDSVESGHVIRSSRSALAGRVTMVRTIVGTVGAGAQASAGYDACEALVCGQQVWSAQQVLVISPWRSRCVNRFNLFILLSGSTSPSSGPFSPLSNSVSHTCPFAICLSSSNGNKPFLPFFLGIFLPASPSASAGHPLPTCPPLLLSFMGR